MEPKSSPESFSQVPGPIELPTPISPENEPNRTPERVEPSHERGQIGPAQPQVAHSAVLPSPVVIPSTGINEDAAMTTPADGNPVAAADDDLIEKEWVDKAKKIIGETREDPHKREQELGKLQADYLRKRYGKELGSS